MIDWNFHSRAHACQACGEAFHDKQPYHTLLSDHKSEYVRMDVCEKCWQKQYSQGANDRKGFISHWQGVYEAPPAVAPDPIQKDTAETLLRKLVELGDSRYRAASFILAVMLERKRLLKVKAQTTENGQRSFVYEHPKTGDVFTIPDPNLQLNQLEDVQHLVANLLEHGLPAPQAESTMPQPVADAAATPPAPADSSAPVSSTEAEMAGSESANAATKSD